MRKLLLYILLMSLPFIGYSQKEVDTVKIDTTGYVQYYIIEGDTIPHEAIDLDEVVILGKLKFKDRLARRKYLILRRKTRKVYPYAKLASDRLTELNKRLKNIKSKKARKKYIKILQKYMEEEFTAELKKMTRTEGQILVKLIHRQTGQTMFDLVKEYRSGWKAFWYNSTAKLFSISLKEEYDPINVEEDYWIEDILQRSFQSNILVEQKTALDFSFYDLRNKWTDTIKTTSIKN
ncbi:DUF4294 domain-containing protein [Aquimarina sp. 2201CG14-23]|uniref:DUF4294 domain-containing protein n=1 Tax=Aquimarina mycalae TaxID=3040073 RepID=UPI0024780974|nr:DUF4294 domain-containing protein [Aquimarina sp. 2201CG14-23]MDH7443985.1 DUF4294 domain-containing protein [Aquimarina sp. 2201CG14-23]